MSEKIVVAGGGAFGTGLAIVMSADQNADITLLMRNADHAADMQISRINKTRLPDVNVPDGLKITSDMSCVEEADILLSVVPTGAQIEFVNQVNPHLRKKTPFVPCLTKDMHETANSSRSSLECISHLYRKQYSLQEEKRQILRLILLLLFMFYLLVIYAPIITLPSLFLDSRCVVNKACTLSFVANEIRFELNLFNPFDDVSD